MDQCWLITQPVKKLFYLVIPQKALILDLFFFGKIFYDEDSLVRYFRFLDPEFKVFFFGSSLPVKPNEFVQFFFQHIRFFIGAVPTKVKCTVPFIYFIGKPFAKAS